MMNIIIIPKTADGTIIMSIIITYISNDENGPKPAEHLEVLMSVIKMQLDEIIRLNSLK